MKDAASAILDPDVVDGADSSLLDLIDNLLNKGVVVRGDLVLGVAGVDLVYAELSVLLCAADRVLPRLRGARAATTTIVDRAASAAPPARSEP